MNEEKLKTLKDFETVTYKSLFVESGMECVVVEELREEAIKWIKKLKICTCQPPYHDGCEDAGACIGRDIARWVMDFFNITEEDITDDDLKEEPIRFCTNCGSENLEKMALDRPYPACNVICKDCGKFLGEEKRDI